MKCKWCGGTGDRGDSVEPGCEHCQSTGSQIDPPFGGSHYTDRVISDVDSNTLCCAVLTCMPNMATMSLYDGKYQFINTIISLSAVVNIPEDDIHQLTVYWCDPTCGDTWGDIIQRIMQRVHLHIMI